MEDPEVLRAAEDDQVPLAGVQHMGQGRTAQGARLQRHQGWYIETQIRIKISKFEFSISLFCVQVEFSPSPHPR